MTTGKRLDEAEARTLSKLLFEARELITMYGDVIEHDTRASDGWVRRVVTEIDAYRAERGWSPGGFGGESAT